MVKILTSQKSRQGYQLPSINLWFQSRKDRDSRQTKILETKVNTSKKNAQN